MRHARKRHVPGFIFDILDVWEQVVMDKQWEFCTKKCNGRLVRYGDELREKMVVRVGRKCVIKNAREPISSQYAFHKYTRLVPIGRLV